MGCSNEIRKNSFMPNNRFFLKQAKPDDVQIGFAGTRFLVMAFCCSCYKANRNGSILFVKLCQIYFHNNSAA